MAALNLSDEQLQCVKFAEEGHNFAILGQVRTDDIFHTAHAFTHARTLSHS